MYDEKFWKRASLPHIVEFVLTGSTINNEHVNADTAKDLHTKYHDSLMAGVALARDRIIAFDWSSISHDEQIKESKTDEFFNEIIEASEAMNKLAFEIGVIAGAKCWQDIATKMSDGEKNKGPGATPRACQCSLAANYHPCRAG